MARKILTNEQVALKKVKILSQKEIATIQQLERNRFQHIINILDFSFFEGDYVIVMDLADGSLNDLIMNGVENLPFDKRINYIQQIAKGVDELHRNGFIKDLQPQNIMFVQLNNDERKFKLCVTGLVPLYKPKMIGTPQYMPPEQVIYETCPEKGNIWALGQMLFQFIHGKPMFTGNNDLMLNNILQAKQEYINSRIDSLDCAQYFKDLLKKTIVVESRLRLSASQVVQALNPVEGIVFNPPFNGNQNNQKNLEQQQAIEKIKAQKQELQRLEKLREEEQQKRKHEQVIKMMRNKRKNFNYINSNSKSKKKRDIEAEISKELKALEQKNQKELAAKEKEIKEKMAKLEDENRQLQQQDLQKYNNVKVQLEIKKQKEIEQFKQEQLFKQQQEIQKKELEIKQQKEQELKVKLDYWQQQVKKEVEDQVGDKYQKQYEEQARNLKLKQLEEQKQLFKKQKRYFKKLNDLCEGLCRKSNRIDQLKESRNNFQSRLITLISIGSFVINRPVFITSLNLIRIYIK